VFRGRQAWGGRREGLSDFNGFRVGPADAYSEGLRFKEPDMNGPDPLTFRILGKTCVIVLPPTIDGVPPANDAAFEEPRDQSAILAIDGLDNCSLPQPA
jgi:hypothetical protein